MRFRGNDTIGGGLQISWQAWFVSFNLNALFCN
jgi:hypothetical protein